MDKVNQTRYAVKDSPQGLLGTARTRANTLVPINNSGGRLLLVGGNTPELICECDTIPFPHFIEECARVRQRESNDAIAQTPAATDTPVL